MILFLRTIKQWETIHNLNLLIIKFVDLCNNHIYDSFFISWILLFDYIVNSVGPDLPAITTLKQWLQVVFPSMSIQSLHGLNSYVMPEYSFRKVNALSLDLYVHHASLNLYSTRTTIKNYEDILIFSWSVNILYNVYLNSFYPQRVLINHTREFSIMWL